MAIIAPEFYAKNRAELRAWLAKNHETESSVWLIYDKGKDRTLSYDEIVEEVLCYGWIDSVPAKLSDTQSKLYLSKRKPKSVWAKTNKVRVEKLVAAKLMTKAGLRAVEVAKQNGSWDALNKSDNFEIPSELEALFMKHPKAKDFYDGLSSSSHKIILEWIYQAKTDETRMRRIRETVELAGQGIKAHHYRQ